MTPAFKAYFRDHFRSKLKLLLCLLIVALVLTLIYSVGGQKDEYTYYDYEAEIDVTNVNYNTYLGLQIFILCVCAYILPVLEFSLFKKRKKISCMNRFFLLRFLLFGFRFNGFCNNFRKIFKILFFLFAF